MAGFPTGLAAVAAGLDSLAGDDLDHDPGRSLLDRAAALVRER